MPGKRRKVLKQIGLGLSIVLLVYFLDRLSKYIMIEILSSGSSIPVIKNILHLTLVYNTGAAFGMLKDHPFLFISIAAVFSFLVIYLLAVKSNVLNIKEKISLCLILGGTLGNLTDRIRFGYVIDFIDFRVWPVFNIADSCITIGALLLGWSILVSARKHRQGKRDA